MEIIFLDAGVPLTKTFSRNSDGSLEKSAYPLVRNFTTHSVEVKSAEEFAAKLNEHAAKGHCLLKGLVKRPLKEESRAGSTEPLQQTTWSCFDMDNVGCFDSVEAFIQQLLPPEFRDVDYVVQFSASSGVSSNKGINAHVFFFHDTAFTPEQAKLFVTELNLTSPQLSPQLELTAAGTALRYRLDRSVMQNDKLIYIAPPVLGDGVTSSIAPEERIKFVRKTKRLVSFDWKTTLAPAAIEAAVQSKVDGLREAAGMRRKEARYRTIRGGELVLTNPDRAVVTGEKIARGFTYLNLNSGDSWGYYFATENPRYLRNFKGEPTVVLADFLPEYWQQIQERMTTGNRSLPFAFRHRPSDTIWNGVYDPVNERILDLAQTTRNNLPDFFMQYHVDAPAVLEDWTLAFDPRTMVQIDFEKRFCNKWEPTEYMKNASRAEGGYVMPPTIERVLRHVLGDDEECYLHFLNWLAYIFQHREKTTTAWVLSGIQGTGKGVLFSKILRPLFGNRYCVQKQIGALEDRFNADMETALIYNFDEGQVIDSPKAKEAYARFKNMITEETADIRAMRANAVQVMSFVNFIITSNDYDAIGIEETDRRFNVAPRQEKKLVITPAEIDQIAEELPYFASILWHWEASEIKARSALMNAAKARMREASQDWLEQMCESLRKCDLEYFAQFYETSPPATANVMLWSAYNEALKRFVVSDGPQLVSVTDVLAIYTYLSGVSIAPGKFTRMLKHKNLIPDNVFDPKSARNIRGFMIEWKASDEKRKEWRAMVGAKAEPAQQAA